MIYFIVTVHVIVSLFLILVVLLQQGKGADLAGAFGGGGSQTFFGARGATTVLHKLTVAAFVIFVLTCLTLAIMQLRTPESLISGEGGSASAPATPTAPAQQPAPAPQQ